MLLQIRLISICLALQWLPILLLLLLLLVIRIRTHRASLLEALVTLGLQEAHDHELNGGQRGHGDTIVLGTSVPELRGDTKQLLAQDASHGHHGPATVGLLGLGVPEGLRVLQGQVCYCLTYVCTSCKSEVEACYSWRHADMCCLVTKVELDAIGTAIALVVGGLRYLR